VLVATPVLCDRCFHPWATLPQIRRGSVLNGFISWGLIFCERRYLSVKLPKLKIMIDGQSARLPNCLRVFRANQWNYVAEASIGIDDINAIVGHGITPLDKRES
jgi:hypothetical protein